MLSIPPQDDTWAWERLIVAKPEMAERFTGWDQFGGFAWARILSQRPEFADRKGIKIWEIGIANRERS